MRYSAYSSYKDSGVEWLGDVPEHWKVKNLKYGIDMMQTGTTPSTTELAYYNGDINWFNPTDLNNQVLINATKQVTQKAITEGACKMFPTNSVLIVGIGATAGKTSYLASVDSSFNQQITGFHSKKNYNKYLFYLMKIFSDTLLAIANFTTLAILNNDFFKAFTIVMPPLEEQQTIANYLDKAIAKIDTLIAKQTRLIALLKEKRQAVISTAVTRGLDSTVAMKDSGVEWLGDIPEHWTVPKIKYFAVTDSGGTPTSTKREEYYDNGTYPWIRTTDLNNAELFTTPIKITKKAIEDTACNILQEGSVLIGMYGGAGTIGKHALLHFPSTINQAVCAITPNQYVVPKYLHYFIQFYRPYWMIGAMGTRKDPNIGQETIINRHVPIPPYDEQESILTFLNNKTQKIDNLMVVG